MPSDTFMPQDPEPWNGDQFVNTLHTGGTGDIFFDITTDNARTTAWDILNTLEQDTLWDVLNTLEQDTVWDILNEAAQDTLWAILNDPAFQTAWHVFPATIEYISKFLLREVEFQFSLNYVGKGFEACPIQTNFATASVLDTALTVAEKQFTETIYLKSVQTSFQLRATTQSNFTITRVINDQYDEPVYT